MIQLTCLSCLYIVFIFGGENLLNNVSVIINNMAIKERTDGRYEGRLTYSGKRKSFYGKTKTEVKNKAKEYLSKVENGYREPEKIKFADYAEYWFLTYKKGKIEPPSYTRLYRVFSSQVRDNLGTKYIGEIKTSDIQRLIDERANPTNKETKPLALSGLKKIVQFLNPCLKMAVKEGIIFTNPCEDVILPSESYILTETKQQYSLTDKEMEKLRVAALEKYVTTGEYKSRNALSLLLILNLGLRAGEALALEWDDINLRENLIYISKTLQCGIKSTDEDGKNTYVSKVKKSTKTKSGRRVLQINDTVRYYLEELKEYDSRNGISSKYVCCNSFGRINNHRNLQKCLNRLCNVAYIEKRATLHTLRHTFGSTLIRRGIGIEVISKLMGHANITITYNKYIHTIREEEAKAMNMIKVC